MKRQTRKSKLPAYFKFYSENIIEGWLFHGNYCLYHFHIQCEVSGIQTLENMFPAPEISCRLVNLCLVCFCFKIWDEFIHTVFAYTFSFFVQTPFTVFNTCFMAFISGALCFLWCCLYAFYTRDSPGQMASIKPIEKQYIEQSLGVFGQSVEDRLKKRVSGCYLFFQIELSRFQGRFSFFQINLFKYCLSRSQGAVLVSFR